MAVEAIYYDHIRKPCFNREAMQNMKRLRIFCFYPWYSPSYSEDIHKYGSIEYLPNNLCCIVWYRYPWKLLSGNFNPRRLVHLELQLSSLHHLGNETKQYLSLRRLDLSGSESLKRTPNFTGMPNLEYLDLRECTSLEKVHNSLRCSRKLIELKLSECRSLARFPYVNMESLKSLKLDGCSSLEKFPEVLGIIKPELEIKMRFSGIRELPLSIFDLQRRLTELDLCDMKNLVSLPSSICKLKVLVKLDVSNCAKLESLPEEIGDLENLEELDASYTLISRPPSSIVRLNKLKLLTFAKRVAGVYFVFPQVNEGLHSLEKLNLSYCNLKDGGLPEDIGSLSSLKELNLSYCILKDGGLPDDIGSLSSLKELNLKGNHFEYLPRSIAQLSALRSLNLSNCKKLTQLPEFPQQLDRIFADWRNGSFCNSLFQNISSLQHDISVSDSLSLRVFMSSHLRSGEYIPSWFHHQTKGSRVSISLPENWYVSDKFLGFAICYYGILIDDIIAHLIPLCDDGMSSMTRKLSLSNHSKYFDGCDINFFLIPLGSLWDASNANGKTPNDYRCMKLYSHRRNDFGEINFGKLVIYGVRLLYKDETELHIGIRKGLYERDEEAGFSPSKKQRSQVQVSLLPLFPTSPGL